MVRSWPASKNGEAITARGRSPSALKKLRRFIRDRKAANDLNAWRRGLAILGYINKRRVIDLAVEYDVTRGSVNRWLQWSEAMGVEGLRTEKPPGPTPKLDAAQRGALAALVDAGPLAAGYQSGVWTGPMIGDLIEQRFGARHHKHNVPRLLHELGFSIQRPRKRLARAGAEKQANWLRKKFTTHNRFFHTTQERDAALVRTFETFKSTPSLLAGHVARFL